jgi:hypothetical protein
MTDWQRRLALTAAVTVPGVLVRLGGGVAPYPIQLLAYGAAVVAAAFLLAWACEAAQVDIARGVVVAAVAFVAILPEYVIEVHFAFSGQAAYVTANLTGASRLLLGVCIALPAAVALLPRRWRPGPVGPVELLPAQRVELAILALGSLWALRGVITGRLTVLDSLVLIALYGLYLTRAAASSDVGPEPVGVAAQISALPKAERRRWAAGLMLFAAAVILLTAVPFGDAVLGTGALVGISPYLLLQWIVPVATETPELVVAWRPERGDSAGRRRQPVHAGARHAAARLPRRRRRRAAAARGPGADRADAVGRRRALRRGRAGHAASQPRRRRDHARAVRRPAAAAPRAHAARARARLPGDRRRRHALRAPAPRLAGERAVPC